MDIPKDVDSMQGLFVRSFTQLSLLVHEIAKEKGWWGSNRLTETGHLLRDACQVLAWPADSDNPDKLSAGQSLALTKLVRDLVDELGARSDGECAALIHSEISEATEGMRAPVSPEDVRGYEPEEKLPSFNRVEIELADAIIRVMDFAVKRNLRVAEAIVAKIGFNSSRPIKHGGKRF